MKLVVRALFVALMFLLAGTLRWPRLWFLLGFYAVVTCALMIWLKRHDPGLLKERMTANKDFRSSFVRIQADRGHTVCTTGPYRFVRHPMYLATILAILCVPLFLGSLFSLIPAALIAALFVLRASLEDRMLRNELGGYADYAAQVRWKLLPGVW